MPDRLPIPASRVAEVAKAAHVSKATVLRYRQTRGNGSPAHGLHDASLYLIEQAVRELPPDPQLELAVAKPVKRAPRAPVGATAAEAIELLALAKKSKGRVTIIMPEEIST
jgi:hypothetical protein